MDELVRIRNTVKPHNILLVLDAMTGQDAVNVALQFQEQVQFDGVILTKMDGDARGGAALSVRAVTGKPIKFAGSGEKLDNFEYFHPDRMASRILGMGDVLSLIEKAEQHHRREEGPRARAEAAQEPPSPSTTSSSRSSRCARWARCQQPARHDPRHPLGQAQGPAGGRQGVRQDPGGHPLHDPGGAPPSRDSSTAAAAGASRPAPAPTSSQVNQLLNQFKQVQKMMKQLGSGRMPKNPFQMFGNPS